MSPMLLGDITSPFRDISLAVAGISGALTGAVVWLFSRRYYGRQSRRYLIWLCPVSLYFAISLFILISGTIARVDPEIILPMIFSSAMALTLFYTLWPLFGVSFANHLLIHNFTNRADGRF